MDAAQTHPGLGAGPARCLVLRPSPVSGAGRLSEVQGEARVASIGRSACQFARLASPAPVAAEPHRTWCEVGDVHKRALQYLSVLVQAARAGTNRLDTSRKILPGGVYMRQTGVPEPSGTPPLQNFRRKRWRAEDVETRGEAAELHIVFDLPYSGLMSNGKSPAAPRIHHLH